MHSPSPPPSPRTLGRGSGGGLAGLPLLLPRVWGPAQPPSDLVPAPSPQAGVRVRVFVPSFCFILFLQRLSAGEGRARKPWSSVQPRTPGERTRQTWRLRPGFGVVVSLGERDWTNILQEKEGDAKDFPHQLLLGFLHNLEE